MSKVNLLPILAS